MTSARTTTLGICFCFAFGCEFDRSLGDLQDAGSGGDDGTGGTRTATGGSGNSATGGSATSGGSATGGTGNSATGGTGNSGSGGSATSGGSANGGTSSGGTSAGGTAPNGGSGGDVDCYAPDNPGRALAPEILGCPCSDDDVDQCVATGTSPLSLMAMVCRDGRWQVVEDGPCEPTGPGCMLENRVIYDRRYVPLDLLCEFCAWCGISDQVCTLIDCPPTTCPNGTEEASRCRACGPSDNCAIEEHGCLPTCETDDECDVGRCFEGVCISACPPGF